MGDLRGFIMGASDVLSGSPNQIKLFKDNQLPRSSAGVTMYTEPALRPGLMFSSTSRAWTSRHSTKVPYQDQPASEHIRSVARLTSTCPCLEEIDGCNPYTI